MNGTDGSTAERYVLLGLRIGRHVDGIVDAYFGPPELGAAVDAEPLTQPPALVAEADALLGQVEDGWLRDQLVGLRTYAGVLAGEAPSYPDEVEGCYGVRPTFTDEAQFAAAHANLEELLPGDGGLAERYEAFRMSMRVPADELERVAAAVIEEARAWTGRLVELPAGEDVVLEIVRDQPWLAFCYYLGGLKSRIAVNVDLPISAFDLLELAMHETYPGHHAERSVKDDRLVRGRGMLEETIVLVPTPQSLVAEGIAELAPRLVLDSDTGQALAGLVRDAGVSLELDRALAVERAAEPTHWATVNAALLLHERGAGEEEAQAYLERWALFTPERARHMLRFLKAPTSRSYTITYAAGKQLCMAYVGGDRGRFRHLLSEQVRVRELLEAGPI